ncbi:MAG: methyltransferase domain-containing protein [Actinomycetota bacterium]|nr:methyltransferase domain-containing protein [Actinomycetota bacterium]
MGARRGDQWDPDTYRRFEDDRARPFHDLVAMLRPVPGGTMVDLGCGTGELTAQAARTLGVASATGIDNSPDMLAAAPRGDQDDRGDQGLRFELADIASLDERPPVDVVLANASLQWVPDHRAVLADWVAHLRPGGQLAVQVPANATHPSHTTITEVLHEQPWFDELGGNPPEDPVAASVLGPAEYAEVLWSLGATEQLVRLQVYGMEMSGPDAVVEWTSGTTLVRVRRALPPERYEAFVERYRERLAERLEHRTPYYYAFQRILMWARFA